VVVRVGTGQSSSTSTGRTPISGRVSWRQRLYGAVVLSAVEGRGLCHSPATRKERGAPRATASGRPYFCSQGRPGQNSSPGIALPGEW